MLAYVKQAIPEDGFTPGSNHDWTIHLDYSVEPILNSHDVPDPATQRNLDMVPVRARIIWEQRGPIIVNTYAYAASGRLICVELLDRKYPLVGIWLDISDTQKLEQRPPV